MPTSLRWCVVLGPALVLSSLTGPAFADKSAAQEHFAKAQVAFEKGDYRHAAEEFEEAYHAEPHHSPLWNAARSWQRAGEPVRAANLFHKYLREAPGGTRDRNVATQSLAELATRLAKVVVHGVSGVSALRVDDTPADADGVFVSPGEHFLSGKAPDGTDVRKSIRVSAGEERSFTLEPLPRKAEAPPPAPTSPPAPVPAGSFHLPWTVVAVGGALTLVGAGLTTWSGLDSSSKRDAFDARVRTGEATQQELDDGRATQTRTNVLLGVTGGLALLTGACAIFVDWSGKSSTSTGSRRRPFDVLPTATTSGGAVVIRGSL